MSEDIDLKIVSEEPRSRAEFRQLRDNLTSALLQAGFQFDPENPAHRDSGNASRSTIYRLPYTPLVTGEGALRPEIQIETAVWPLRLPSVELTVTSFCAEAHRFDPRSWAPSILCSRGLNGSAGFRSSVSAALFAQLDLEFVGGELRLDAEKIQQRIFDFVGISTDRQRGFGGFDAFWLDHQFGKRSVAVH
jgi:hypothetical protein